MQKTPATAIMPAIMARAPKTHFQLAHSAMRPETRLPQTLPRGAPAAIYVSLFYDKVKKCLPYALKA